MIDEGLGAERTPQREDRVAVDAETPARGSFGIGGVLARPVVGIPFGIGLSITLEKAVALTRYASWLIRLAFRFATGVGRNSNVSGSSPRNR
jgi:hypothetical protein